MLDYVNKRAHFNDRTKRRHLLALLRQTVTVRRRRTNFIFNIRHNHQDRRENFSKNYGKHNRKYGFDRNTHSVNDTTVGRIRNKLLRQDFLSNTRPSVGTPRLTSFFIDQLRLRNKEVMIMAGTTVNRFRNITSGGVGEV